MRQGKTRAQSLRVAERRAFVFNLRRTGASYELILQAAQQQPTLQLPKGYNTRCVHADVLAELTHIRTQLAEDVELVRTLECDRLDRLLMAVWPRALQGYESAVDRALKIMIRRAKLLGLDAASKFTFEWEDLTDTQLERLARGEPIASVLALSPGPVSPMAEA